MTPLASQKTYTITLPADKTAFDISAVLGSVHRDFSNASTGVLTLVSQMAFYSNSKVTSPNSLTNMRYAFIRIAQCLQSPGWSISGLP